MKGDRNRTPAMLPEVPGGTSEAHADMFPGAQLKLVLASIAAGNTAARLWVGDQGERERIALLWDKGNNVFYLAGHDLDTGQRANLQWLIASEIRPQALAEGRAYFRARALTTGLDQSISNLFEGVALREIVEQFYGLQQTQPNDISFPQIPGIGFVPIDSALLAREDLVNIDHVKDEVRWMWGSEERFYAHGVGYAAVLPDRVLCWCTAEYVSAGQCGIGIATDPEYRRRGVATATAARFAEECLRRGKQPFWECAAGNLASARVAEKVGFELLEQTPFLAGSFAP